MRKVLSILTLLAVLHTTNALYFFLGDGVIKCFKDELVKNSEIQARVSILDPSVNAFMQGSDSKSGIYLSLVTPEKEEITRIVKPDELFSYNTTKNGEFKLCVKITDDVYKVEGWKDIKTSLKFSNEYYKLTDTKNTTKGVKQAEVDLKGVATEGHFAPLKKRTRKISKLIDDIIAHQEWEREKEQQYKTNLSNLSGSFFNLVVLQLIVVLGSAIYSVISLRKFFVKKHIY